MLPAPAPKHDERRPRIEQPDLFVLLQVEPVAEVLATSASRERLLDEARILAALQGEAGDDAYHRWVVRQSRCHLG